jgi:peptidoglycan/LPS O-acetylase OafA/YrhL
MSVHCRSENIELCTLAESQLPSAKKQTDLPRDAAIDFTKGALVLFMVLYHWLNYFVGTQGQYYDYLKFLTPSFIFITGFMISQIQLRRYGNSGRSLSKRLFVRGLKLLALFLVLNALVYAALSRIQVASSFWGKSLRSFSWAAFVVGTSRGADGEKSVIFNILVPIAYLLIVSAGLVVLTRRIKYAFYCTLCMLIVAVMSIRFWNLENLYLDLLMVGVLGVVFGFAGSEQIASVISHPSILAILYCLFLAVITIWGVPLPLQIASVILTTALLYTAGSRPARPGASRRTILLGKYSLLGYIAQIAILQGLRRISWLSHHGVVASLGCLLFCVLMTVTVVVAVDIARQRSKIANDLYRLVFA